MGEELAIIIVIGLIVLINAIIRKVAASTGKQRGGARAENTPAYEASEEQVRQFLDQIRGQQGAGRPEQAARPQGRRRPARAQAGPQPEGRGGGEQPPRPNEAGREGGGGREARPSRPRRRPARRKEETQPVARAEQPAAPEPAPAPERPGPEQKERTAPAFLPEGLDLKTAVVMLEILRPPVSRRGHIAHRPPIFDR